MLNILLLLKISETNRHTSRYVLKLLTTGYVTLHYCAVKYALALISFIFFYEYSQPSISLLAFYRFRHLNSAAPGSFHFPTFGAITKVVVKFHIGPFRDFHLQEWISKLQMSGLLNIFIVFPVFCEVGGSHWRLVVF